MNYNLAKIECESSSDCTVHDAVRDPQRGEQVIT
jgi:hypothetical protein